MSSVRSNILLGYRRCLLKEPRHLPVHPAFTIRVIYGCAPSYKADAHAYNRVDIRYHLWSGTPLPERAARRSPGTYLDEEGLRLAHETVT
jgi:hypothetical protein